MKFAPTELAITVGDLPGIFQGDGIPGSPRLDITDGGASGGVEKFRIGFRESAVDFIKVMVVGSCALGGMGAGGSGRVPKGKLEVLNGHKHNVEIGLVVGSDDEVGGDGGSETVGLEKEAAHRAQ